MLLQTRSRNATPTRCVRERWRGDEGEGRNEAGGGKVMLGLTPKEGAVDSRQQSQ